MKDKTIINCHTHIFTVDHVPNYFTKKLIPVFYKIFSMNFIKWYYRNCTLRGNIKLRKRKHQWDKLRFAFLAFFRKTVILNWIYLLVKFLIRWVYKVFSNITRLDLWLNKRNKAALERYLTMGRYSVAYKSQAKLFELLKTNYAPGTQFVVLSMDMEYMDAGRPNYSYLSQLEELKNLRQKHPELLPFVAVDPRRLAATQEQPGNKNFENYVKNQLQKNHFSGIKLYPALGYFPFDKNLISLYKFAAEHQVPIITHCDEGTVFYRGTKKKEWNRHPILKYSKNQDAQPIPIPLPQAKNYDFTTNFTHPLNYHCLLDRDLLSQYIPDAPDLSKLKICLAHFGGEKAWEKYDKDIWNFYNNNISQASLEDYLKHKNTLTHASRRTIWWNASWLSIIYDLMIKYENVYADTSFILHNEDLYPLLKFILEDNKVKDKILFGTDYYVVSHKNSEKILYHHLRSYLGDELFYQISHINPKRFLRSNFVAY